MSRRLLVLVVCAGALLAGCRVDAAIEIAVRDDGSGVVAATVTLDDAAVRRVEAGGGRLEERVVVADLVEAGWQTEGWVRTDDAGAALRLAKEFSDPAAVAVLVEELVGPAGVVHDVEVVRERSRFRSRDVLTLVADLDPLSAGVTGDDELRVALGAAGVPPEVVELLLVGELAPALSLTVTASVPGDTRSVTVRPGESAGLAVEAGGFEGQRVVVLVLAAALGVLGVALLVAVASAGRRRRRRARGGPPAPD